MIKTFFNANRRIAAAILNRLPQSKHHPAARYSETIADLLNHSSRKIVLDIGAGKRTVFAEYLKTPHDHCVVGVDIATDDLALNTDLQGRCVADVSGRLPFADNSVDMIVSHHVLEHLPEISLFFGESARVLKPGGAFIHLFPGKFALFALINQCLPHFVARRLLLMLNPASRGIGGFPAHYKSCYPGAIRKLLKNNHMRETLMMPIHDQSGYFGFFLPFYICCLFYEMILTFLAIGLPASHYLLFSNNGDKSD